MFTACSDILEKISHPETNSNKQIEVILKNAKMKYETLGHYLERWGANSINYRIL